MPKKSERAKAVWQVVELSQQGNSVKEIRQRTGRTNDTIRKWIKQFSHFQSLEETQIALNPEANRYVRIIEQLFKDRFNPGSAGFVWERDELDQIAKRLGVAVPKNLGDNIYSICHGREDLPDEIRARAPEGKAWLLLPNGKSSYKFVLTDRAFLSPDTAKKTIKIPDSTPQIVARWAKQDEQAVLARIRYCRLVDIFMGLASYQLQSHMRTTIAHFNGAQTELDELYVGVDANGTQFIIPIQAKSPNELIGAVQIVTDYFTCKEKFRGMIPRTLAAQTVRIRKEGNFGEIYTIALIESSVDKNYNVTKLREEHFELVPSVMISDQEMEEYQLRFGPRIV